jgi:predicted DNA-binding transcriptional regulator AlpA
LDAYVRVLLMQYVCELTSMLMQPIYRYYN